MKHISRIGTVRRCLTSKWVTRIPVAYEESFDSEGSRSQGSSETHKTLQGLHCEQLGDVWPLEFPAYLVARGIHTTFHVSCRLAMVTEPNHDLLYPLCEAEARRFYHMGNEDEVLSPGGSTNASRVHAT